MLNVNVGQPVTVGKLSVRSGTILQFTVTGMGFPGTLVLDVDQQGMLLSMQKGIQGCPLLITSADSPRAAEEILGDLGVFMEAIEVWMTEGCPRGSNHALSNGETFLALNDMEVKSVAGPGIWDSPPREFTLFLAEKGNESVLALLGNPPFRCTAWRCQLHPEGTPVEIG